MLSRESELIQLQDVNISQAKRGSSSVLALCKLKHLHLTLVQLWDRW
jgi:hypothetical protein